MNFSLIPWWVKAIVIAAIVAAYSALWFHIGSNANAVDSDKVIAARDKEIAQYKLDAQTAQTEKLAAARTAEETGAAALAVVSANYQKELQNEKARSDSTISAIRSGALRLSIPAASAACGGGVSEATAGASGRDGGARAELSDESSEFFVGEDTRADGIVKQLSACQEVIRKDRETINTGESDERSKTQ